MRLPRACWIGLLMQLAGSTIIVLPFAPGKPASSKTLQRHATLFGSRHRWFPPARTDRSSAWRTIRVARFQQSVLPRVAYNHLGDMRLEQVVQPGEILD
jgi:hypothetical protein